MWTNKPNSGVSISIESLLADHLRPVAAPAALWDRVTAPKTLAPSAPLNWALPLTAFAAMAAVAVLALASTARTSYPTDLALANAAPQPDPAAIVFRAEHRAAVQQAARQPDAAPQATATATTKEAACQLCHTM